MPYFSNIYVPYSSKFIYFLDELDLVPSDMQILPLTTEIIQAPDSFEFSAEFQIEKSDTSSATDPSSLDYELVISSVPDMTSPDLQIVSGSSNTHSDMGDSTITGKTSRAHSL